MLKAQTVLGLVWLAVLAPSLPAQSPAAPTAPAFEVASVKPAAQELLRQSGLMCAFGSGGRFRALATIQMLIACAYGIPAARDRQDIVGGPNWLNDDLFQIEAKLAEVDIPRLRTDGLLMLRTLLADRFKLRVHRETKEAP